VPGAVAKALKPLAGCHLRATRHHSDARGASHLRRSMSSGELLAMLTRALAHSLPASRSPGCSHRITRPMFMLIDAHAVDISALRVQPTWPGTMATDGLNIRHMCLRGIPLPSWPKAHMSMHCRGGSAASQSAGTSSLMRRSKPKCWHRKSNQTKWRSQCWLTRRTCQAPDPVQIAVQARPAQAYVFMCLSPFDLQSGQPCIAITHTALER
jgi:hypothetical protein